MRLDKEKVDQNKAIVAEKTTDFFVHLLKYGLPENIEEAVPESVSEAMWLQSSHRPVFVEAEEGNYKKFQELMKAYILSCMDNEGDGFMELRTDYQADGKLAEMLDACQLYEFNARIPFKARLIIQDHKVIYRQRSMKKDYIVYKWLKKDLYV